MFKYFKKKEKILQLLLFVNLTLIIIMFIQYLPAVSTSNN
jgi:uncharacterized membrane protein YqjE